MTSARGTVIDRPSGTLLTQPQGTVLDSDGATAPTLFDDGSPRPTLPGLTQLDDGERRTEPGLPTQTPSFPHGDRDDSAHPLARPVSSSRLLFWLAIVLVGSALAAVAAWALRQSRHRGRDLQEEMVPPPAVKAPVEREAAAPPEDAETPANTEPNDVDAGS